MKKKSKITKMVNSNNIEFLEITQKSIEKFREKLLDLGNRNNLINLSFNPRSNKNIRVIDELPNKVYEQLKNNDEFSLIALPEPEGEPEDENTPEFIAAFDAAYSDNGFIGVFVESIPSI